MGDRVIFTHSTLYRWFTDCSLLQHQKYFFQKGENRDIEVAVQPKLSITLTVRAYTCSLPDTIIIEQVHLLA